MKFSILVPVYNVEKYLEQCVESLLSQTYKDAYEIILVNDGSTDSSGAICDRYAKKYPDKMRVVHKENQGLISARDEGIAQARGEYCVFVDSDDFVEKNLLETVAEEIAKSKPDMVIYSFQYCDDDKIIKRKVNFPDKVYTEAEKRCFYESLISSPVFKSLWTKAVKTEILKNDPNNYTEYYGKDMGEDYLRAIHLFTQAKIIACKNIPLYNYRINRSSISKSFSADKICRYNQLHIYEQIIKYLPQWDMDNAEYVGRVKDSFLKETIYTFSNFYENANSNKERRYIVDYDWSTFLPPGISFENAENTDAAYFRIYRMIIKKRYTAIRLYFIKKALYKKYKTVKAGIRHNG